MNKNPRYVGKSGDKWVRLSGRFDVTLDDKYRITLPVKFRKELNETLVITEGLNKCLYLFTSSKWEEKVASQIDENASVFSEKDIDVMRKYIAPSHDVELDKMGRFIIPEDLRKYAGILKDCKVAGMLNFIEIWDSGYHSECFGINNEKSANAFKEASEEFGRELKIKKGITE